MISDLGIPVTIWNLAVFGLVSLGLAVVVVLVIRWASAAGPPATKRSTRADLEALHAEHDRQRVTKRPQ